MLLFLAHASISTPVTNIRNLLRADPDHSDVQHSPIFDSHPENGLGTWGDPAQDFSLQDGGFSGLSLSYPSAHILRRNFTIQPWVAINTPHLMKDPELYANTTFTQSEVRKMVDGFIGDFIGMQEYLETFQVRGRAISTLS